MLNSTKLGLILANLVYFIIVYKSWCGIFPNFFDFLKNHKFPYLLLLDGWCILFFPFSNLFFIIFILHNFHRTFFCQLKYLSLPIYLGHHYFLVKFDAFARLWWRIILNSHLFIYYKYKIIHSCFLNSNLWPIFFILASNLGPIFFIHLIFHCHTRL